MRPGAVVLGLGAAVLGHVVAGVIGIAGLVGAAGDGPSALMLAGPVAEAVLGVGCLWGGIVWTARRKGGFGIGLLIGWAVGLLVTVVFGLLLFVAYWAQGPGK